MRRSVFAVVSAFVLAAGAAAAPPKEPVAEPVTGLVKEVGDRSKLTYYRVDRNGKPVGLPDILVLDAGCKITIDGKAGTVAGLEREYRVTMWLNPANGRVAAIEATSPGAVDQAKKQARQDQIDTSVAVGKTVAAAEVRAQEAARRRAEARAAALEAAYAQWLEEQRQAAARLRPPVGSGGSGAPPGSGATGRGPGSNRYANAVFKAAAAVLADYIAKDQAKKDGLIAAIGSELAKRGRDTLIESALRDVFDDQERYPDAVIRAARRVICLYLDGKLSVNELVKQTAIEEIKAAIEKENPRLAATIELAEFVYAVGTAVRSK